MTLHSITVQYRTVQYNTIQYNTIHTYLFTYAYKTYIYIVCKYAYIDIHIVLHASRNDYKHPVLTNGEL